MITFNNLPLAFTLGAWEEMEKDVCSLDELFDMYRAENNKKRLAGTYRTAHPVNRRLSPSLPTRQA